MSESKRVSLKKKGWTDPETGEYYPGGNPNEISKAVQSQNSGGSRSNFAEYQPSAFPEMEVGQAQNNVNELYPQGNTSPQHESARQNEPDPDLSVHIEYNDGKKFCKFCGKRILMDAVVCTYCGRQVELLKAEPGESVVVNRMTVRTKPRNSIIALLLCIIFGPLGVHRFYEGKFGTGLLWLLTGGLFTIGWITDIVKLANLKKRHYYIDDKGNRKELK